MKLACVSVMLVASGVPFAWGQQPAPATPPAPSAPAAPAAPSVPAAPVETTAQPRAERPGAGREFDLHPKWVVGDVQRFEFDLMSFNGAHAADDAKKRSGQLFRQAGRIARKVVSTSDKETVLALTIERFYLQESRNTKVQYYDTDYDGDPNRVTYLTPRVQKWKNKTITVHLDKNNEVTSVSGVDPDKPLVGPLADAQQDKVEPVDINEMMVRKFWRPLYRLDKPTLTGKIGETWTMPDFSEDPEIGRFDLAIHHELKDVTGGVVTIESTADVKHTPIEGPDSMNAKMTSAKVKGTYEWDLKRGLLRSWSTEQETNLDAVRNGAQLVLTSKAVTMFQWMDPDAPKPEAPANAAPPSAGAASKP